MPDVDLLHQILTLIEEHGLSVVLLAGLLIAWIATIRWAGKKFDQLWRMFISMRGAIPDTRKENLETLVVLNTKVKSVLREMMIELSADWCHLWQFHNGTHGIGKTRIPFMFLTLTHEVCRDDCDPMRAQFAQLPLSMFDKFAQDLLTEDLLIHQWKADKPMAPLGQMIHGFGAEIGFLRAVRDEDNRVIGFVVAAWKKSDTITERRKGQFFNGVQRMAAVLAATPDGEGDDEKA
jgi:hypothetical protein